MGYGERRQTIARVRQIAEIAARNGFGFLLHSRSARRRVDETPQQGSRGERLATMFDELGPTFVKFGQMLSTRPDLLPPDVVSELRRLQDRVQPFDWEIAKAVVENDLGPIDENFASFDEVPIAAASIGQVHGATLIDGREVVVKVQRPDAPEKINADLALLEHIARVAKTRVKRLRFVDTVAVVAEFRRAILQELDYRIEARNVEMARRGFTDDPTVIIPEVIWDLTTTRVLVLERIDGLTLNKVDLDEWSAEDRRTLAARISETWMTMVFDHGVFHGDPHPANIIVRGPDQIGLVDFGMVGQLSMEDRQAAIHLFLDLVDQRIDRLPRRLRDIGLRYPVEREDELRDQLGVIMQRYWGVTLENLDVSDLLRDIMQTVYQLGIRMPPRWIVFDKAIATLSGVAMDIAPDFNVFETARPHARRLMMNRYRPDVMAGRLRNRGDRYREALMELPFQVHDLMSELRDGELKIAIQQEGFTESTERALGASNRFALAILASAVFLGSSIMAAFLKTGPEILGITVVALPGVVVGTVLAVGVLIGVLRSGRW